MRAIGLMSGTSLDGIDAVLVEIVPRARSYAIEVVRFATVELDEALRAQLVAALPPGDAPARDAAALDAEVGPALGEAAVLVAGAAPVDFVASHGITLFHDGAARRTIQIGDPYAIRERVGSTVVFDFRRGDCAAGGQGAPLVPYVDALLLADARRETVALNLGGIANLTLVPPAAIPQQVRAWDTGPGNLVLDAFVRARTHDAERFDRDGRYAASGRADAETLAALLQDDYFALAPPKSTGRERFGDAFVAAHATRLNRLSLEDGCATLVALTAESVARSIGAHASPGSRVVASGGGTRNPTLLAALTARLPSYELLRSDEVGIDADAKEAMAFAVLGYEALRGRPAGLPRVTGAAHPAVLGAIAPLRLAELLAKMTGETAANGGV